jgi:hypothetical protein
VKANHALCRICTAIFMIPAPLVLGCAPEVTTPAPLCSYLPEPAISRVDHGPLTLKAALRKCEADHRVAQSYLAKGYEIEIVATTENYSGQSCEIRWTRSASPGRRFPRSNMAWVQRGRPQAGFSSRANHSAGPDRRPYSNRPDPWAPPGVPVRRQHA